MNDPRAGLPRFLEALAKGLASGGLILDGIQATFRAPTNKVNVWTIGLRAEIDGKVVSTQWQPPQGISLDVWPEGLAEGLVLAIQRMQRPPERKILM